jgi:nucleoside-diphosphate-sugar epimerase
MLLSICIPTYERTACLNNCLNSIYIAKKNFNIDFEVCISDNNSGTKVNKIVNNYEYIFHLAALISIPYSYEAFHSYTSTNINGTLNILNVCKNNKIKRLMYLLMVNQFK